MCLPEEQQLLVQEAHLLLGALAVAQLKDTRDKQWRQRAQQRLSKKIKPVWIYHEIWPCRIECAANDLSGKLSRAVTSVTIKQLSSEMNASFGQNIVDECSSLSLGTGYERILNNTEVKFSCVETMMASWVSSSLFVRISAQSGSNEGNRPQDKPQEAQKHPDPPL